MYMTLGLYEDEVIIWKGKPDTSFWFTKGDIFFIPFSLMMYFGALAGQTLAINLAIIDISNIGLCLFVLPFFALSLYFLFGRFIWKYYVKKNEEYYLTSQRIIIKGKHNINAMPLRYISQIKLVQGYKGCGTLLLGYIFPFKLQSRIFKRYFPLSIYHNSGLDPLIPNKSFRRVFVLRDIQNAEEVNKMIRRGKNPNP